MSNQRRNTPRRWTEEEDAIVRLACNECEVFTHGTREALEALHCRGYTDRTYDSVRGHAVYLREQNRMKYEVPEWIKELALNKPWI